ncbi:MAG: S-methyl-5-thioribose-1-phosphate isomerase [Chloroflexi bacterium]|nr:S-methyl-5-thioribose-1-phosphate isomerase [Chloroflexota bacterium]
MNQTTTTQPLRWEDSKLVILDQRRLPGAIEFIEASDYLQVADAIKEMCVRGAPAIGVAGAYGAVLGALKVQTQDREAFLRQLRNIVDTLLRTRPTAVNLRWALERIELAAERGSDVSGIKALITEEAKKIHREEADATDRLSEYGADLIAGCATIMTHCNAGALATCGCGTALGVIRAAARQGKIERVIVDETRPLFQGARLTAWELKQEGIPVTLIVDSAAGHFLSRGLVNCVIVGADRIAANGDTANKIGTYSVADLASENGVPFYVAAPVSTVDLSLSSGDQIPIEERRPEEVTGIGSTRFAATGIQVANPAFDVTPSRYITAIITDRGVARPPYQVSLSRLIKGHA